MILTIQGARNSGKTRALKIAASALRAAGYKVIFGKYDEPRYKVLSEDGFGEESLDIEAPSFSNEN